MDTKHYLRLLRTFALATLTAAAVAACSDDTDTDRKPLTPPDGNNGIPITFTANINPGSDADPAAEPGTRTVLTPTDRGGFTVKWRGKDNYPYDADQIHIWATNGTTVIPDRGPAKTYVLTTSAASSPLVPLDDQSKLTLTEGGLWKFTAVYGLSWFTADGGEPYRDLDGQTQLQPDNTEYFADKDFSIATVEQHILEASEMPSNIDLKFGHKLSALQLRVKNGTDAELRVKEIRLAVVGNPIAKQRVYDMATGKWKTEGEQTTDYLPLTVLNPMLLSSGGTASQNFHMLLFPGYENKTLTITVITDRGEYTLTKPAPAGGFTAGTNYMTDITIRNANLDPDTETWRETIRNALELAAFRNRVNGGNDYAEKTVYLVADIDLMDDAWTPIGTVDKPFSGTFDGGGYHISNLTVNSSTSNIGLFGCVDGTVRNLRVSGTVTTTGNFAGGIAGAVTPPNGMVENCIFSGEVSGKSHVGGIVGGNIIRARITGCYTQGSVTATEEGAGGIAGRNDGEIDDCYSKAEVTAGIQYAGGIAARTMDIGTVTRCYATGKVSSAAYAGGIIGDSYDLTTTGCIALNPSITRTSGSETSFGRIASSSQSSTVTNCGAYDGMTFTDANGSFDGAGEAGTDLTREQCVTGATYSVNYGISWDSGWNAGTNPLTYLPWIKAFESFPNISETDYRISVPAHLKAPVIN